jgi:hypothetical protein
MFLAYLVAILYISVFYDTHYFTSITILARRGVLSIISPLDTMGGKPVN